MVLFEKYEPDLQDSVQAFLRKLEYIPRIFRASIYLMRATEDLFFVIPRATYENRQNG